MVVALPRGMRRRVLTAGVDNSRGIPLDVVVRWINEFHREDNAREVSGVRVVPGDDVSRDSVVPSWPSPIYPND